jgi:hypothetical protein
MLVKSVIEYSANESAVVHDSLSITEAEEK